MTFFPHFCRKLRKASETTMELKELVTKARTCRRFKGEAVLSTESLTALVDYARLSASARNAQILRYVTVSDAAVRAAMDKLVVLGGALTPEQRATDAQRPGGYIVICGPATMDDFATMDVGIAAQTINLAACEAGLRTCMIGAMKKDEVAELLGLPEDLKPKLVMALGVADEEVRLVGRREDGKLIYFRDANDVHCVPKITLEEAVIMNK